MKMRLLGAFVLLAAAAQAFAQSCELPQDQPRASLADVCPALLEQINALDLADPLRQFVPDTLIDAQQLAALQALLADYRRAPPEPIVVDHADLRAVIEANSRFSPLKPLGLKDQLLRWIKNNLFPDKTADDLPEWLRVFDMPSWVSTGLLWGLALLIVLAGAWVLYREAQAGEWFRPRRRHARGAERAGREGAQSAAIKPFDEQSAASIYHVLAARLMAKLKLCDDRALTNPERARLLGHELVEPRDFLIELAHAADAEEFGKRQTDAGVLLRWRQRALEMLA